MSEYFSGYENFSRISVRSNTAPFTPDEIHAAEIEAAREEGRRAGLEFARGYIEGAPDPGFYRQEELEEAFLTWRRQALRAIEAKAKEV